jgi:hypothetical protein
MRQCVCSQGAYLAHPQYTELQLQAAFNTVWLNTYAN